MTTPTPMTAERLAALLNSSMVEYVKSRTTEDWIALSETHPAALVREMGVKILLLERDLAAAQVELERVRDKCNEHYMALAVAQEANKRLEACVHGEVPEGALNALGRWLAPVLDEDKWATAEPLLNAALLQLLEAQEALQAAEGQVERLLLDSEAAHAAITALRDDRTRLQQALFFWLPSIAGEETAAGERAAKDSRLLISPDLKDEPSAYELGWIVMDSEAKLLREERAQRAEALAEKYKALLIEAQRECHEDNGLMARIDAAREGK